MNHRQLQVFTCVAGLGGIHAAARQLGVTQPAVTKTIRELEKDLGAALFNRSLKGVALTPVGQALMPRAQRLLEEAQRARDEIAQIREGTGRISIGLSASVAISLLPAAFRAFRTLQPHAKLHVAEGRPSTLLADLANGQLDFAVMHVPKDMVNSRFVLKTLCAARLVVGVRRQHPLANSRELAQLLDAEWILPTPTAQIDATTQAVFLSRSLPVPSRIVTGQSATAALALVGQTDLVGLFVDLLAEGAFREHGIQACKLSDPFPEFKVCIVHRSGETPTPVAAHMEACFRQASVAA